MAVTLTDAQKQKLVRIAQLETFKQLSDNEYKNLSAAEKADIGVSASTVKAALKEIAASVSGSDVTFEKLSTANVGKLATYRFTKGEQTMDIDIEKDLMNETLELVTIVEGTEGNAGKYFDGVTEVKAADGVTSAGVYMKYNTAPNGDTPVYKYANMAGVIEYLTVGTQTGKAVTLTIDSAAHTIVADINAKAIQKSHLSDAVQASLDLADSALQSHQDISGKADKVSSATAGNFAGLDANGNLTDSGVGANNFKTVQNAVSDPTANGNSLSFIASISQDTNGVITPTKATIPAAAPYQSAQNAGQDGVMSAADKAKLDDISYASDTEIYAIFGITQ